MLFNPAAAASPSLAKILRWASDPQNWIGVIAVITVLGLQVGAFEPEELHTEAGLSNAAATWTVASSQVGGSATGAGSEPVFVEAPLHQR